MANINGLIFDPSERRNKEVFKYKYGVRDSNKYQGQFGEDNLIGYTSFLLDMRYYNGIEPKTMFTTTIPKEFMV